MKQLLLILLLIPHLLYSQITVSKLSGDPRSPVFILYYNNVLSVTSEICNMKPDADVIQLNDWYIHLETHSYWLYMSNYHMLFRVSSSHGEHVSEHLIMFINLLKQHYQEEKYLASILPLVTN